VIADRCFIGDTNPDYQDVKIPIKMGEIVPGIVKIGDDSWIGINVAILRNVTIGRHCIIGANSVVTKDISPDSTAARNPADYQAI
jgi:acetyltransferase-like isoleucine patch superfamily enzyme